jgi:hypothetical protein
MWIIPKQLHALSGAPDTEAFLLDLNEQSQACEHSLLVRSKPSPARTWLLKWKRDSWTQHLFGRILKPSHVKPFEIAWTSLWQGIHANPSPQPESDLAPKTQDTCGPTLPDQLELFAPECASLRMSKDISASDSERSLENWNQLVTRRRGEYSLRVKSARLTNAKGSSSWPTATVNDATGSQYAYAGGDHNKIVMKLPGAVIHGQAAPESSSSGGSRQGLWDQSQRNWQTFAHGTHNRGETPHRQVVRALVHGERVQTQMLTVDQVFAEEIKGTNKQEWRTPTVAEEKNQNTSKQIYLQNQVGATLKQWATPNNFCFQPPENTEQWTKRAEYQQTEKGVNLHKPIQSQVLHENEKVIGPMPPSAAKLNPRWVETLMGLPVGWVMPSCASPVTIAPTNFDCSETESCQPPPSEPSEP